MKTKRFSGSRWENHRNMLLLSIACLGINLLGSRTASSLELPLYLDNIGSALAAALGGFIPGIIVGFLTNLINGIRDYQSAYYGSLTILIAVCSSAFANKGYYGKIKKLPVIIIVFSLIGGALGSLLTWLLYGFSFGEVIQSKALAEAILSWNKLNEFWSQFSADMIVDLFDKTITVVVIALILHFLPKRLKEVLHYSGWRQQALSVKTLARESRNLHRRSLRVKVVLVVALATLVTGVAVTVISFSHFRDAANEQQTELARGTVNVVAGAFRAEDVDGFLLDGEEGAAYRKAHDYDKAESIMKSLMDSSDYIDYCYVYRILPEGCIVVFDPDRNEDGSRVAEIGGMEEFDTDFLEYLPDMLAGKEIEPVNANGKYGWLLTFYKPVYDKNGVCQCYAGVDVNMAHIAKDGYQFLARVISLFFGFFIIILTVAIWLAEYNVILPINSMAIEANRSAFDTEEARAQAISNIERLDIRTQDEIENLYTAMIRTTKEMANTTDSMAKAIAQTQKQNALIGKMQNGLIMVLADMVESRDQNTGEHVRKTAAYTGVIMRELRREHIYEDQLTDEFIQDVMNSAPLHDVGKIKVPDQILNKPGKLTDEEFSIMKTHTTSGAEIINSAMNMVSEGDSGYLKEARNLAEYHHEKWNGMGYPCGLKGKEIPLSARIMAVADVFDALVSKRSYKDEFSFEKAMGIIREGSGTHFDPNVANAFISARDEVREIMENHMMGG